MIDDAFFYKKFQTWNQIKTPFWFGIERDKFSIHRACEDSTKSSEKD